MLPKNKLTIAVTKLYHPTQHLENNVLNKLFNAYAMANLGNYKDIEWMNQIRKVTLN